MTQSLVIDDLSFAIRRSPKRKTLRLSVERNGELLLTAPVGLGLDEITSYAKEKRLWVYTKLVRKGQLKRPLSRKEFVSGETFHYLGRSHRLLIVPKSDAKVPVAPLRLHQGRFLLQRDCLVRATPLFREWYLNHARAYFPAKVAYFANRIGVKPLGLQVIDLGYRWGSCSADGRISINWQTAQLPPRIIEYILVHELVHLVHSGHGDNFLKRIERVLPDYQERKSWLAEHGGSYSWKSEGASFSNQSPGL